MVIPLIFQATYSTVIREALESNDTSVFVLFMYLSIYKCKQLHSNYNDSSKTCILWELLRSYILFGSFHLQVSQTWIFIQDEDSKIVPSLFLIFFLPYFFYEESKITDLNWFFFFVFLFLVVSSPCLLLCLSILMFIISASLPPGCFSCPCTGHVPFHLSKL